MFVLYFPTVIAIIEIINVDYYQLTANPIKVSVISHFVVIIILVAVIMDENDYVPDGLNVNIICNPFASVHGYAVIIHVIHYYLNLDNVLD